MPAAKVTGDADLVIVNASNTASYDLAAAIADEPAGALLPKGQSHNQGR